MKYINRIVISNPDFDYQSLKDIEIKFLNIAFRLLADQQLFKFKDIIINEPVLQKRHIIEEFIKESARAAIKAKHDSKMLKTVIDFSNHFKINFINLTDYLDYIKGDFRIKEIEDYLEDDPMTLYYYFNRTFGSAPYTKDEIQKFEKIFAKLPKTANKYFYDILEDLIKAKYTVNDSEIGAILKKEHPYIYNAFINEKNIDIRFIHNYTDERLPLEIENKMFERKDPENISYIANFIKDRVPQFEKTILSSDNREYNIIIKYFERIVPYYLIKLKDRGNLEILKRELNTTFEPFIKFFADSNIDINQMIMMFDKIIKAFMNVIGDEKNEEKHQFFINELGFLMNSIKKNPEYLYFYCLKSYRKPWREAEDIFLKNIDDSVRHGYTIISYLRDVVLSYYDYDLKKMLKDYSDFEKKILLSDNDNKEDVIMSYMSNIRGRWPEGEAFLIEKNKQTVNFSLSKFIKNFSKLKNKV